MTRKFISLWAVALLLTLVGCSSGPKKTHGEAKKIAPYLYEMEYYDMDETAYDYVLGASAKAACSSVRNGAFHGRNLDLFYNEGVEVVVHMAAGEDRYASLAVCGANPDFNDEKMANATEEEFAKIPLLAVDGINENKVVVNVNVVPAADYPAPEGTNPGARRLFLGLAPRYVLNHAKSAEHAVELLQNLDLFGGFGPDYNLHLMISDPKETYIVEFIDNTIKFNKAGREDESNVMTNLYSTLLPELTLHAEGVERYDLLTKNYAEGNTEEGMTNLMKRVKYTQAYELETDPFWYSEGNGVYRKADGTVEDRNINTPHEEIIASMGPEIEVYKRHERKGEFWQTVNTSIYNIDEGSLLLFVQEDYEHSYRFKI